MKKSILALLLLSTLSFSSIVRNVFITDSATGKNAIVDSTGSLLVVDTTSSANLDSIIAELSDILAKLIDIETNQTDRSQWSKISDGIDNLSINAIGEALVKDTDSKIALDGIQENQTDKTQWTKITDGTHDLDINSDGSAHVSDGTTQTILNNILSNQTDKDQYTRVTNGAYDWSINPSGLGLVYDADVDSKLSDIEQNQTDKTQQTRVTDGVNEAALVQHVDDNTELDGTRGLNVAAGLYARVSASIMKPLRMDASTHSLQLISYEHHEIHSGSYYRVQANGTLSGSGGTLSISFYVPSQAKNPHMIWESSHEGSMTIQLLEGTTLTLSTGTDVLCKNSNRTDSDQSILQGVSTGSLTSYYVTKDATYSGGTVISDKRDYSSRNEAGGQSRNNEIILNTNTYYTFVLTNNETTSQGGQIRLAWYEHEPKD